MLYLKLSLLSSVLIITPVVYAMNFHQKMVETDQKGLDLRVMVALESRDATLPCNGVNTSLQTLLDDHIADEHNLLNKAMLYVLEQGKIVNRGAVIDCVDRKQLLELYRKGVYAVYAKRGNTLPILLLGASDFNGLGLLTKYLIFKSSQTKENQGTSTTTPRVSDSRSRPAFALVQERSEDRVV